MCIRDRVSSVQLNIPFRVRQTIAVGSICVQYYVFYITEMRETSMLITLDFYFILDNQ